MDRDDLAARIDSYAHRQGASDAEILTFIEDARTMLGEDLRSGVNLVELVLLLTDGEVAMPADYVEIFQVFRYELVGTVQKEQLQYATPNYFSAFWQETGDAMYYTIEPGGAAPALARLRIAPTGDTSVFVQYFQHPAELTLGTSENTVLTRFPQLYLFACLRLAAIWAGDGKYMDSMARAYGNEVSRINARFRRSRAGADAVAQGAHAFAARPAKGV
jgi:hypothetical protein